MKFRIYSSFYCMDNEIDELLDDYPVLKNYGFEVIKETRTGRRVTRIKDENEKPMVQETPYTYEIKKVYVNIDTLEQLMSLIKDVNCHVIVDEDTIEIYDSYRE